MFKLEKFGKGEYGNRCEFCITYWNFSWILFAVFNDGTERELFNINGTIPVQYKSESHYSVLENAFYVANMYNSYLEQTTLITFQYAFGWWTHILTMRRWLLWNQLPICESKCPCMWITTGEFTCHIYMIGIRYVTWTDDIWSIGIPEMFYFNFIIAAFIGFTRPHPSYDCYIRRISAGLFQTKREQYAISSTA